MRALFAFMSLMVVNPSAFAEDFVAAKMINSRPVAVTSVTVRLLDSYAPVAKPIGSYATFELSGVYEGGWCWFKQLAIQLVPTRDSSSNEGSTIQFFGLQEPENGSFPATSMACAGGAAGKFSTVIKVEVNGIGSDQEKITYTYAIPKHQYVGGPSLGTTTLDVTYDVEEGWSYEVH